MCSWGNDMYNPNHAIDCKCCSIPVPFFDDMKCEKYPNGVWSCGYPGEDHYYANTQEEALNKWKRAYDED